jgi:hypothetical protein
MTSDECRSAISKITKFDGRAEFKQEENESQWPTGCYITAWRGRVFWNKHQKGSTEVTARQVCIQSGV